MTPNSIPLSQPKAMQAQPTKGTALKPWSVGLKSPA